MSNFYKEHLKRIIAISLANSISDEDKAKPESHVDRRLCDCTNCRMGKSSKCSTFKPSKANR